jgi:hypothetical protein
MPPSPEKDKNTLEKDIYKVLPAVFGTMQYPILAVVCSPKSEEGRNIIHLIVVVSDVLKIPDSLSEDWSEQCKLLDSVSPSKKKRSSVVVKKFQSARTSLRKRLSSAWAFFKKALCIVSVLYLIITLLALLGYFLFFRDNSLEITLPETLSNNKSVSVWAYDNDGQPCEQGKKLSQDDPRHIIKCESLQQAKTIRISGYKVIVLDNLKNQNNGNGRYQVQEADLIPPDAWTVKFTDNTRLPFSGNTKVQFFNSELDCENNQKSQDWRPYNSPIELQKQPHWAKIFKGDDELSYCAAGTEHFETQDFHITFSFKSNVFEGKRKIVVIAPSVQLASDKIGKIIQKTLKKWLFELKTDKTTVPITILLIDTNEEIHTLIRSEDLAKLPYDGQNSITAKVNQIRFVSDSFRSVYELESVDRALEGKDFDQVLYLTDGESYSGGETISSAALGIPLVWQNKGVRLSVLTVGECGFWNYKTDAKCDIFIKNYSSTTPEKRFYDLLNKLKWRY